MKTSIRVAMVAMIATICACGSQALIPYAVDGTVSPATQFDDGHLPARANSEEDQDKPDLGSAQGERGPTNLSCAEADLKRLSTKWHRAIGPSGTTCRLALTLTLRTAESSFGFCSSQSWRQRTLPASIQESRFN
jgi:hypothetical protein